MRVLLDTQVWLWLLTRPERLGPKTLSLLENERNDMFLSSASSWEIAIKYRLGKLPLPEAPGLYIPDRMRRSGVEALSIEHSHALAVASLEDHHRDPVDRILVAQAQVEGLSLVSADPIFAVYGVSLIDATL
ncbi:MAG: type II toxin-antitoxin system VapC family toxin [Actinomycetota bacterium]|nr:type II toxin-antitoxin system VapC family toxin [Actinomycetota bacterium]MDK1016913.1 type II toxin-antitoxin system VapC family toxin [Actinomycetota bacterium]MDK1026924.1 type II toxin-antitoxin system VapC family toxin [Actinomycetota bacterium]MDK1037502.1 type II toxin-antitoxin system VapC family toxin [Actinomycetota bacterium]MDK1095935.1 type II toxin-antitoxin system VapC family toxin [Actinomycetota bacterium]